MTNHDTFMSAIIWIIKSSVSDNVFANVLLNGFAKNTAAENHEYVKHSLKSLKLCRIKNELDINVDNSENIQEFPWLKNRKPPYWLDKHNCESLTVPFYLRC